MSELKKDINPITEILLENNDNYILFKALGLEPGKAYFSPVNKEQKPSTYIYYNKESGKYLFKDFSSGKGGGPIEYVALKYCNGDKTQAKKYLIEIIQNSNLNINESKTKIGDIFKKTITFEASFIKNNNNYFTKKFNIPLNKLAKYGVLSCESFVINETKHTEKNTYIYINHRLKPLQIYRAYKKEKKHINLCSSYEYHFINNNGDILFICGSLKDGIVTSFIFDDTCDVLCLLNENYTESKKHILNKAMTYIKNHYKLIYLLFDNDKKGMDSSEKISKNYPFIVVPDYNNLYGGYKDISDYLESNKFKNKKTIWNKLNIQLKPH